MFPSRDEPVDHLERHASEDGIELKLGTRVERIDRANGGWAVATSAGELRAPQVIAATGYEQDPIVPDWNVRDAFGGELVHSPEYRNPEPFTGRRVLVVGPGRS